MGIFSRFEGRMEDTFEGAADKLFDSPISPVQIAKKAEREMRREKMVGAGKMYAPTLYTVLVNPDDDRTLFGYYPTLAGETETYLSAKALEQGYVMDGHPLVRFVVDDTLRSGKFDIIAELVSKPILVHLRAEEMRRYGLTGAPAQSYQAQQPASQEAQHAPAQVIPGFIPAQDYYGSPEYEGRIYSAPIPGSEEERLQDAALAYDVPLQDGNVIENPYLEEELPYVPENEIDRSIDYGKYTFNSEDFVEAGKRALDQQAAAGIAGAAHAANPTTAFAAGAAQVQAIPQSAYANAFLVDLATQQRFDLASGRLIMGRDSGSDIVVNDLNASRTHAELRVDASGNWMISDLGSTNGTKVNGQRIASSVLRDKDRITIGVTNYNFRQIS